MNEIGGKVWHGAFALSTPLPCVLRLLTPQGLDDLQAQAPAAIDGRIQLQHVPAAVTAQEIQPLPVPPTEEYQHVAQGDAVSEEADSELLGEGMSPAAPDNSEDSSHGGGRVVRLVVESPGVSKEEEAHEGSNEGVIILGEDSKAEQLSGTFEAVKQRRIRQEQDERDEQAGLDSCPNCGVAIPLDIKVPLRTWVRKHIERAHKNEPRWVEWAKERRKARSSFLSVPLPL